MKKTLVTAFLTLSAGAAVAHHADPQYGLLGSIAHWLTEPDHLLLVIAGTVLAIAGHQLLARNQKR